MTSTQDISNGSIGYLLWQVALRWRVAADRELAPLGLTHAKFAILGSLYGLTRAGEEPSQRELADHSGLEPMYVSKLVRALADASLVSRKSNPSDPRAVALELTPQGRELATKAAAVVRGLQARLLQPLGGLDSEASGALRSSLQLLLRHTSVLDRSRTQGGRDTNRFSSDA